MLYNIELKKQNTERENRTHVKCYLCMKGAADIPYETPHYKALANHFPKLERIELSAMKLKARGYDSMILSKERVVEW